MRRVQLYIILFFGGLSLFLESRNIRESSIFGGEIFYDIPFYTLCIITIYYLIKNNSQFIKHRRYAAFIPATTGIVFIILIVGNMLNRSSNDKSLILFTAYNYDIGNDGGFRLDFKDNNYLKAQKIDRFSTTYYWGTYERFGDSLMLDIPLDFKMGNQAILQDSVMHIIDDTLKFYVDE